MCSGKKSGLAAQRRVIDVASRGGAAVQTLRADLMERLRLLVLQKG